uniref:Transposase n=1 Tax=Acrobeloides nanus TaxID=290746 RepID=A0A914EF72_9BILA
MANGDIYQFKVTLRGSKPPIWRRIQVPANYNFWDLHVAIADVMGWKDYHLHLFEFSKGHQHVRITTPHPDDFEEFLNENVEKIAEHFSVDGSPKAMYEYDFGDKWQHDVVLEKIVASDGGEYPRCFTGKRACPPEDCGGIYGFYDLLKTLANENHPEHAEIVEWLEDCGYDNYNPAQFDASKVVFEDPVERAKFNVP